jgi:hypothetical protein
VGKRQHFVPRFYLKAFGTTDRLINLYNIRRRRAINDVSLRDQCYTHNMYGADGAIEGALADLERIAARVIDGLREDPCPPVAGDAAHLGLLAFVILQLSRTEGARAAARAMAHELEDAVFEGTPPSELRMNEEQALTLMLGCVPEMLDTTRDLAITSVIAGQGEFLTSDNPAFKYNQYCEGVRHFGVTGTRARGLQIFLPLSPQLLLMFYDAGVYKVGTRRRAQVVQATQSDVFALNRLQFMNAQDNIFYHDRQVEDECQPLLDSVVKHRTSNRPRVVQATNTQNQRDVLLHQFWPMPQLNLRVSFVSIRRDARRIDLFERSQLFRDGRKASPERPGPGAIRFKVRR